VGIETVAIAALAGGSAMSSLSSSRKEAKGVVRQGELEAANLGQKVIRDVATQKSSFLNSGFTLEGTPTFALTEMLDTGLADVNQIKNNYTSKSKNIIAKGRTDAIKSIASAFSGASMGGSSLGMANSANTMFGSSVFGSDLGTPWVGA